MITDCTRDKNPISNSSPLFLYYISINSSIHLINFLSKLRHKLWKTRSKIQNFRGKIPTSSSVLFGKVYAQLLSRKLRVRKMKFRSEGNKTAFWLHVYPKIPFRVPPLTYLTSLNSYYTSSYPYPQPILPPFHLSPPYPFPSPSHSLP